MKRLLTAIMSLLLIGCAQKEDTLTADEIIQNAIERAGGELYEMAEIDYTFRDRAYKSYRNGGRFSYTRIMTDSLGNRIKDVLDNDGLTRKVNDSNVAIQDSLVLPIGNSINSVNYFVHLPYGLMADAANRELVGKDTIAGREYYEIKVTFSENGGGTDHEDEYLYWIDTQNFEVDYLAYNFEVNDGGVRFRKAFNHRVIKGISFVDYENYEYKDKEVQLTKLDSLYQERELDLLSIIETKNVRVKLDSIN
ncbi:DUF6503 family protein [Christiangramia portivictoriae]|uniref:DUF6503 family protein n=1 Tax=Christiangramia portivictoriae TaxID=326069 RepID=UPI0003F4B381|nr:DUF6503 family protein [Christiangramia portivictoriae]